MISIVCERCGGNEFKQERGKKICLFCGTSFVLTPEESPQRNSNISISNDIQLLLMKCREDPKNAYRYASLVLDIDPGNNEAIKFLSH